MDIETFNALYARKPRTQRVFGVLGVLAASVFLLLIMLFFLSRAPSVFPTSERIEIPFGTSVIETAHILDDARVVRSSLFLQILLIARFGDEGVKAGVYQFTEPLSVFAVARAVTSGTHGTPLVRVTIPEGMENDDIALLIHEALPQIAPEDFAEAVKGKEGYLFPETYHVPETYTAPQFAQLMENTFIEKIADLESSIQASGRTREDIITMASILEREANTRESMRLVSGILWKRLDEGIPLQVDASFAYLLDKTSEEITLDDLEMDSPYNTYRYRGLPPTPISNPGLTAIEAALVPEESPYYFYLTAPDGTFYYAVDFDEHIVNKQRYLR